MYMGTPMYRDTRSSGLVKDDVVPNISNDGADSGCCFSVVLQKRISMTTQGVDVKRLRTGALLVGDVKLAGLVSEWNLKQADGYRIVRPGDIINAVNDLSTEACNLRDVLRDAETVTLNIVRHSYSLCNW